MKQNHNSRRINAQAREKLAQILLFDIADPDLFLVTLTGVEVSIDKSVLHAYVSCEADRYESVAAALDRARGRVRSLLGRSLGWRVTPEIIWHIDTTVDDAERIERALQDVPPTMEIEKDEEGYPVESNSDGSHTVAADAGADVAEGTSQAQEAADAFEEV